MNKKQQLTVTEFCAMVKSTDIKCIAFINFIKQKFNKENLSWIKYTKSFNEWEIEFSNFINK